MVAFRGERILVGEQAKRDLPNHPSQTVSCVKRLMGRRYGDEVVQQHKKSHPHTDIIQKDGNPFVEVLFKSERQAFSPEEISSFILEQMKTTVLNYAGGGASSRNTEDLIESAIITVPGNIQC